MNRLTGLPSGMNTATHLEEATGGLAMLGQILVSVPYLTTYLHRWPHIKMNKLIALPWDELSCGRKKRWPSHARSGFSYIKPIPIVQLCSSYLVLNLPQSKHQHPSFSLRWNAALVVIGNRTKRRCLQRNQLNGIVFSLMQFCLRMFLM